MNTLSHIHTKCDVILNDDYVFVQINFEIDYFAKDWPMAIVRILTENLE